MEDGKTREKQNSAGDIGKWMEQQRGSKLEYYTQVQYLSDMVMLLGHLTFDWEVADLSPSRSTL